MMNMLANIAASASSLHIRQTQGFKCQYLLFFSLRLGIQQLLSEMSGYLDAKRSAVFTS